MRYDVKMCFVSVLAIMTLISGCSSVKVRRTEVDKVIDLSGQWNDSDSRMVSEEMIKDCLSRAWLNHFTSMHGRSPVVIVGTIKNRTSEHIDARLFISDLERNLINSGLVRFVAASPERLELRAEKDDQAQFSSKETAKPSYQEMGADFMLQGNINSIKDQISGQYVIFYQVNLEMIDLTTNEKVWIGQKEIKKVVSRRTFGL